MLVVADGCAIALVDKSLVDAVCDGDIVTARHDKVHILCKESHRAIEQRDLNATRMIASERLLSSKGAEDSCLSWIDW